MEKAVWEQTRTGQIEVLEPRLKKPITILVGIPALNESSTIGHVISNICLKTDGVTDLRIVVVDDGSTDDTGQVARSFGAHVIRHNSNRGLGAAFQSLIQYAVQMGADVLVTIDADGQFDPKGIPTLIGPVLAGQASVVTASRFLDPALTPAMPWAKRWGNRRVAGLVSSLTGNRYYDVSCGFRAYSKEALLRLTVYHSFTYTHETFLDLASKGLSIMEIPMVVKGTRECGTSRVARNLAKYAIETALILFRSYRDRNALRLCSYLSLILFVTGAMLFIASLVTVLQEGSWLKWAAMSGGALMFLAVAVFFFGFLADSANCLRRNQEEILYLLRQQAGCDAEAAKTTE
jgi:glycosyltransferase involved in cell wall biosynthesis